jgi:PqqD family protein of HPr-rel-A system
VNGIWSVSQSSFGCLKYWPGEAFAVFYATSSGETHLLDEVAIELYEQLTKQPMTQIQLYSAFSDAIPAESESDLSTHLSGYLSKLKSIGLLHESDV